MRKVTLEYPDGSGATKDAMAIDVVKATEPWMEYELEDGTVLRARTTVVDVIRVDGEYDPDGNPVYQIRGNATMSVIAPESLKRKRGK
jgi:hypothetical protein